MIAFQFPSQVTSNGHLFIPAHYRQSIPPGSLLQVVLLVEPPALPTPQDNGHLAETDSVEEYVAYLRSRPLPPSLITSASGLLGEHLAHPLHDAEPDFDEAAWNQQWDEIESAMNAAEQAGEQARLQELAQDLQQ